MPAEHLLQQPPMPSLTAHFQRWFLEPLIARLALSPAQTTDALELLRLWLARIPSPVGRDPGCLSSHPNRLELRAALVAEQTAPHALRGELAATLASDVESQLQIAQQFDVFVRSILAAWEGTSSSTSLDNLEEEGGGVLAARDSGATSEWQEGAAAPGRYGALVSLVQNWFETGKRNVVTIRRHLNRRRVRISLLLSLLTATLLVLILMMRPPSVPLEPVSAPSAPLALPAATSEKSAPADAPRPPPVLTNDGARPPRPLPRIEPPLARGLALGLRWGLALVGLALMILASRAFLLPGQRARWLESLRQAGYHPGQLHAVEFELPPQVPFRPATLELLATSLGRLASGQRGERLDVSATLERRLRDWLPEPVFGLNRPGRPVLVLIDLEGNPSDPFNPWLAGLEATLDYLERLGVALVRRYYACAPDEIFTVEHGEQSSRTGDEEPPSTPTYRFRRTESIRSQLAPYSGCPVILFSRTLQRFRLDIDDQPPLPLVAGSVSDKGEAEARWQDWIRSLKASCPQVLWIDPGSHGASAQHEALASALEGRGMLRFGWDDAGLEALARAVALQGQGGASGLELSWEGVERVRRPRALLPATAEALRYWAFAATLVPDPRWALLQLLRAQGQESLPELGALDSHLYQSDLVDFIADLERTETGASGSTVLEGGPGLRVPDSARRALHKAFNTPEGQDFQRRVFAFLGARLEPSVQRFEARQDMSISARLRYARALQRAILRCQLYAAGGPRALASQLWSRGNRRLLTGLENQLAPSSRFLPGPALPQRSGQALQSEPLPTRGWILSELEAELDPFLSLPETAGGPPANTRRLLEAELGRPDLALIEDVLLLDRRFWIRPALLVGLLLLLILTARVRLKSWIETTLIPATATPSTDSLWIPQDRSVRDAAPYSAVLPLVTAPAPTGPTRRPPKASPPPPVPSQAPTLPPGRRLLERSELRPALREVPGLPGSFLMGAYSWEAEAAPNERPQRKVTLTRRIAMFETEVTQSQYEVVIRRGADWSGARARVSAIPWAEAGNRTDALLPANYLSWYDAVEYANRLSFLEGREPCYTLSAGGEDGQRIPEYVFRGGTCRGYRLPTEAEWEYTARAGTWNRYAGTNDINELCTYANIADIRSGLGYDILCDDGSSGLAAVQTRKDNGWGFYDMTGNAFEWTNDRVDNEYYMHGPEVDPEGPSGGEFRAMRGGVWWEDPIHYRVAYRYARRPDERYGTLTMRLVRTLP